MKRRDFLKSLGMVTAGSVAIGGTAILSQPGIVKPIEFDKGTLKRYFSGGWELEFEGTKLFNTIGQDDIVVELGELKFLLKNPGQITFTKEYRVNREDAFIHWLSGTGWEQIS